MTFRSGRHFLQIPGPTNVPDGCCGRWTCRPWIIAARSSRCSGVAAALDFLNGAAISPAPKAIETGRT